MKGSQYDLWGILRAPRNVNLRHVCSPEKLRLLDSGLNNFVGAMKKEEADSGEVLFMVECKDTQNPEATERFVALLSGTCYNPKVCDIMKCDFKESEADHAANLNLPCDVRLASRPSKIIGAHPCLDCRTSTEFSARLAESSGVFRLYKLQYFIPFDIDGSLLWSRITGMEDLGVLWAEGQKRPWGSKAVSSQRDVGFAKNVAVMQHLSYADPFAEPAKPSKKTQTGGGGVKRKAVGDDQQRNTTSKSSRAVPPPQAELAPIAALATSGSASSSGISGPAQELEGPPLEGDMDMADDEPGAVAPENLLELEATYGTVEGQEATMANQAVGADIAEHISRPLILDEPNPETMHSIAEQTGELVAELGLEDLPAGEVSGAVSTASAVADEDAAEDTLQSPPLPPWEQMSEVSRSGYVNYDGRTVMRVQRGKPTGRLTLTCYRHTRCNLLLNLDRAPTDEALKRWLFEVEPNPPGASKELRQELAKQHMGLAKTRWSAPLR